jgi:hypothetical protein
MIKKSRTAEVKRKVFHSVEDLPYGSDKEHLERSDEKPDLVRCVEGGKYFSFNPTTK